MHDILDRLISRQHSREDLPENIVTYSDVLAEHLAALKLLVAASQGISSSSLVRYQ